MDWGQILAAALPVATILVLVAGLRWNTIRSGAATWLITLGMSFAAFGMNASVLAVSQAKAVLLALDVLYIVWGALLFHRVFAEAGVVRAIGESLPRHIRSRGLQILAIAWVFASFLQGAGGFGVPVVVTAPLLVGMGIPPVTAVVLPAVGHAWAVTFGSLGTSFNALMSSSGFPAAALAPWSALTLGLCCLVCGILVGWIAVGRKGFAGLAAPVLGVGLVMAAVQFLLAVAGLWQVAALGAGLAGLGTIFLIGRSSGTAGTSVDRTDPRFPAGIAAYGILVAIILVARFVPPIRDMLSLGSLQAAFPAVATNSGYATPSGPGPAIPPFGHAGALLMYAAAAAFLLFRRLGFYPAGAPIRIVRTTLAAAVPLSAGILAMAGIAALMTHSGMTAALAEGAAAAFGGGYPLAAPWIGALGAFLTGSNTNSNLLFVPLQQRMAQTLGYSAPGLLAAQTAGGAVGSVLSPAKVLVGASGAAERVNEGSITRALFLPIGLLLIAVSAAAALMALWLK